METTVIRFIVIIVIFKKKKKKREENRFVIISPPGEICNSNEPADRRSQSRWPVSIAGVPTGEISIFSFFF